MLSKAYLYMHRFWERYSKLMAMLLVLIAAITAFWLRSQQYFNVLKSVGAVYPEARLDELDTFVNYWVVSYMDKHGFFSYFSLTSDNPATCLFWYPECRNIYATELPGHIFTIYFLYQLSKPLGVSLYDLMAFIPPILGALGVIFTALAVKELTKSDIGAISSAYVYALMFMSREVAGFTVKYSFGLFTAPMVLWLHARVLRKPSILNAAIAGIAIAYAASVWTGVGLTAIPILITLVLTPLMVDLSRKEEFRKHTAVFAVEVLIPVIAMVVMPPYRGVRAVIWMVFLASLALYLVGWAFQRLFGRGRGVKIYTITVVSLAVFGFTVLGLMATNRWFYEQVTRILPVAGKILLGLGINPGGVAETVAQYRPGYFELELYMVLFLLILAFLAIPIALYDVVRHKSLQFLAVSLWGFLAWYATYNTAYFSDYTRIAFAVTVGTLVGRMLIVSKPSVKTVGRIVKLNIGFEKIVAALIAVSVLASSVHIAYGISVTYYRNKYTMLAQAEGFFVPTDVWLKALDYIRRNTSSDALIVSWWDYGYWLSIIGNRSTLADGATINSTKIQRLAKFFTYSYNETYHYLREFGVCKRSEVYIVIFSPVDIYIRTREPIAYVAFPVSPAGFGDMPKFISAIVYLATGRWATDELRFNRSTYQFELHTNHWVIYATSAFRGTMTFLAPNIASQTFLSATMPRLFMWAATEKIKELFPGFRQVIVPTILGFDEGGGVSIYRDPEIFGFALDPKTLDQHLYDIEFVSVSQPFVLYQGVDDAAYRYVLVAMLKPKDEVLKGICS